MPMMRAPQSAYPYFDKVQIWLEQPVADDTFAEIKKVCGRGSVYRENRAARFNRKYRQRIELRQPGQEALRWVSGRSPALVTRLEVAIDYVFATAAERDAAFKFLHFHLVRRWHGPRQEIKLVREDRQPRNGRRAVLVKDIEEAETRYDAGRAANKVVFYRDPVSRATGEPHCLHLEWHLNGQHAVTAAGISSANELLDFDHREFWRRRLLLVEIHPERLGRIVRNARSRTKSRTALTRQLREGLEFNLDEKAGYLLLRGSGSAQQVTDRLSRVVRVQRARRVINNEAWLPTGPRGAL